MAKPMLISACPADDHLPPWRRLDRQEDPADVLSARLEQLRGLASCVTVLGRADRTPEVVDELIDDALPMLGWVMQELTVDAIRAMDAIERRQPASRPK